MKQKPESKLTTAQKDLMVRGQIGNTRSKIRVMLEVLETNGLEAYLPYLADIAVEVDYLEAYLPPMNLRKPPK